MKDVKRLSRLLDLRKHEERRRAAELGEARRLLDEASEGVRRLETQRSELERVRSGDGSPSVGHLKTMHFLVEQLDKDLSRAREALVRAQGELDDKVEAFSEAANDSEALERVIEPRRSAAQRRERASEQKQQDDMSSMRHLRNGDPTG
jgi:flagellar export protein FliJ